MLGLHNCCTGPSDELVEGMAWCLEANGAGLPSQLGVRRVGYLTEVVFYKLVVNTASIGTE